MPRIILYTGKGGVGKTTVAAATALACARRGQRTIVLSTDVAHSLGDALDRRLGPEPIELLPGLWAQEPDVYFNISRYWGTIQAYVAELFSWNGLDEVLAEEMTVLPGMDELGSLLWIADHVESGRYDTIVVDAAPTGETLRLLSLPEASRWWVERVAPLGRRVTRLGGPLIQRVIGVPVPDESVFEAAERLLRRLDGLNDLLTDPELTSVRLVLNLERTSISESQRSFTYFHLYGYPSDLVVCNRLLPADPGAFLQNWRSAQEGYLEEVQQAFAPLPIRIVPHFEQEVVGIARLERLGEGLFGDSDPAEVLYRGRPYAIRRDDGRWLLSLQLPFASKEDISLQRRGDELLLQVGQWRRTIVLPRALIEAPTEGAHMDDSTLTIEFTAPVRPDRTPGRGRGSRR
ncbi:MAG TPA: ArsA family ATPase [Candidatus Limnocylindrales bacterium]|nr:ArsA family ATPase [Candidatus Limnocylindrales bacterium]